MKTTTPSQLEEMVAHYRALGWAIVPNDWLEPDGACSCYQGQLCQHKGKHPLLKLGKGWKNKARRAKDDPRQWENWLWQYPFMNLGLVTGEPSGVFVLDVDGPRGMELLRELEGWHQGLPPTAEAITGGGGRHFYFLLPLDGPVPQGSGWRYSPQRSGETRHSAIDTKSEGGQTVLPPSWHASGKQYCWAEGRAPWETPPAPAPAWLLQWLRGGGVKEEYALAHAKDKAKGQGKGRAKPEEDGAVREGARNNTLSAALFTKRKVALLAGGDLVGQELRQVAREINDRYAPPMEWSEVERICQGVEKLPHSKFENPITYDLNDYGNSRRLLAKHQTEFRYAKELGWLCWDGQRWASDDEDGVRAKAQGIARDIKAEALAYDDERQRAIWLRHARNSGNSPCIRNMVTEARPACHVSAKLFDGAATRHLLNLEGGTLNMRTLQLYPPSMSDYITKLCPTPYDPGARCPHWLAFLDRIMQGDREMIAYLQLAVGYSLTGYTSEHAMFLCQGPTRTGKSTFIRALIHMLGEDYARPTMTDTFLLAACAAIQGERPRPELLALVGARLVSAVESGEDRRFNENLLKAVTGEDTLSARGCHQNAMLTFTPSFKIWLATNHLPRISDPSGAVGTRLRVIKFQEQIPEEEQDKALLDKLNAEAPGILKWALEGARRWLEREGGLALKDSPSRVSLATASYVKREDLVGRFLEQCCVEEEGGFTRSADLWRMFSAFLHEDQMEKKEDWTQQRLGAALSDKGFEAYTPTRGGDRNKRGWRRLRLKTSEEVYGPLPEMGEKGEF